MGSIKTKEVKKKKIIDKGTYWLYYRCQFCDFEGSQADWDDDGHKCPKCGKRYDPLLAGDMV